MSTSFSQNAYSTFGEQIVVEATPIVQITNKYRQDPAVMDNIEIFEATGGSSDNSDNMFRCQTGTSAGGYGVIRSKNNAIYLAGEAIEGKVTAAFTTGIATSLQFAGLFSLTETAAFGYDGANFSVIYEHSGKAEVQTIQVTATPSGTENATVTLDGDAVVISITNSTVQTNAEELRAGLAADGTLSGKWRFEQVDDSVICISKSVGNKTGTMSFSSSTATATVTETTAGAAKTSGNVAQASWDTAPFTGFDPTKLNLYKISFGYLGAANLVFEIYNPSTGKFQKVHTLSFANTNTTPQFGNPDMKIGWTAASLGSSGTNLIVTGGSAEIAVNGSDFGSTQTFAADNSVASVSTTLTNILTIKNRVAYGGQFNLGKIRPVQVSVENDHTKGIFVEVYKNTTLGGTTNFQFEDENNSIATVEKAGTTITGGTLIDSFTVAKDGSETIPIKDLNIELLNEDQITIAAKTISGTSTSIEAALVWEEQK